MNPAVKNLLLQPQGIVKNGLVAWYDFQQGADAQVLYDKSGYGYHGQLGSTTGADTNDPTWTAQGLSFGGDDYVGLPFTAKYPCTLEIVFSITNPETENGCVVGLGTNNGNIQFTTNVGLFFGSNSKPGIAISEFSANTMIHVTVVYVSSSDFSLYKNGYPAKLTTTNSYWTGYESNITLGARRISDPLSYLNNGAKIAYLAMYEKLLTPVEIKRNFLSIKKELGRRGVALG